MINTKLRLVIGGACLMAFVASGCSDSKNTSTGTNGGVNTTIASSETAAGGSATPPVAGLTIENSTFSAASVVAGTAFTIANNDGRTHTVTDDAGAFDVQVPGGGTASLTITAPGTYQIHCKIHSSMHGTITVT